MSSFPHNLIHLGHITLKLTIGNAQFYEDPPQDQEDQGELLTGIEEWTYTWNEEDQSWDWTLIWASEQNDAGIDLSD